MGALGERRRGRWPVVLARLVWVVTGALLLAVAGVGWATYRDVDETVRRSAAIPADAPRSVGAVNVLVLGLTTRLDLDGDPLPDELLAKLRAGESDRGGYNANTLMLLHVPDNGGQATVLSIPRDNLVDLAGVPGRAKIKEAYGRAKAAEETRLRPSGLSPHELEHQAREAGRRAQIETVRMFLDVPVDHLVEISLVAFYHLAEAVGGIDVCVNRATVDRFSGANLVAGVQHLDPSAALSFVRQRHGLPNGDLDRTRRQQAFLASVGHRLAARGLDALPGMVEVASRNLVVDEGLDLMDLARRMTGPIRFHTLPIERTETVDGESVNVVDVAKVRAQVADLIGPAVGRRAPGRADRGSPPPVDGGAGIPCVD